MMSRTRVISFCIRRSIEDLEDMNCYEERMVRLCNFAIIGEN